MSRVYFCSDLHLGHWNILKYEPIRLDFVWEKYYKHKTSLEEFKAYVLGLYDSPEEDARAKLKIVLNQHDELIINNWNNTVGKDDVVWFLGDLCMGNRNSVRNYLGRLQGIIRMIKGNHDTLPTKVYLEAGARSVYDHPVVLKQHFILSHAPIEHMFESTNTEFINVFGHVHSNPEIETVTNNQICVCIERQELKPIQLAAFDSCNPTEKFSEEAARHSSVKTCK